MVLAMLWSNLVFEKQLLMFCKHFAQYCVKTAECGSPWRGFQLGLEIATAETWGLTLPYPDLFQGGLNFDMTLSWHIQYLHIQQKISMYTYILIVLIIDIEVSRLAVGFQKVCTIRLPTVPLHHPQFKQYFYKSCKTYQLTDQSGSPKKPTKFLIWMVDT